MPKKRAKPNGVRRSSRPRSPRVEFISGKVLPAGLPISEGARVGNLVFLSGQLGIRPGTLELVRGGVQAEAEQALENLRTLLGAYGCSLRDVAKCTVFLADIDEWPAFNEVYKKYFATAPHPARSAVACALARISH